MVDDLTAPNNFLTDNLHHLGSYRRALPHNTLPRMMENAYDWEHLPFVHPGSFASIELVDEGAWGWRAEVTLPAAAGGGEQLIELRVDAPNHYWATTVLEGTGEGVQIHTQASDLAPDEGGGGIEVDVRFYLPQAPETDEQSAMILGYLQAQYATLYDEDEALMSGRQAALDAVRERRGADDLPDSLSLGPVADLDEGEHYSAKLASGDFTVRHHAGEWSAHAAVCPHLLGPLSDAEIAADGAITCPWHGYRFPISGGAELGGKKCSLPAAPPVKVQGGDLIVG